MLHETDSNANGKPNPSSAFAFIDRAWDSAWALRLYCLIVFIDLALLSRTGKGLLDLHVIGDSLWQLVGYGLASLAVFGVCMSIVFPTISWVLAALLQFVPWEKLTDFDSTRGSGAPQKGDVMLRDLREFAMREKDEFALARYEEQIKIREEIFLWDQQLGRLVFSALVLSIIDGFQLLPGTFGTSLLKSLFDSLGDPWAGMIVVPAAFASLNLLWAAWFNVANSPWVYYPLLADLQARGSPTDV